MLSLFWPQGNFSGTLDQANLVDNLTVFFSRKGAHDDPKVNIPRAYLTIPEA